MSETTTTPLPSIPDTAVHGWHFSEGPGGHLYDGRPVPEVGEVASVEGNIILRQNAMHLCPRILDALKYAPGPYLERVAVWGDIATSDDKVGGRHRVVVERWNVEDLLRRFARRVALDAIETHYPQERAVEWGAADEWDVMVEWLRTGEGDRAATWAATWAARATWSAAGAARSAARATWSAAEAARSAAEAAKDAARHAAWDRYNDWLMEMVAEETGWDGDADE